MQAGNSNSAPRTITNFLPALLAQLIPNTTTTHTITYTNILQEINNRSSTSIVVSKMYFTVIQCTYVTRMIKN